VLAPGVCDIVWCCEWQERTDGRFVGPAATPRSASSADVFVAFCSGACRARARR
jgi:hypothetical protein